MSLLRWHTEVLEPTNVRLSPQFKITGSPSVHVYQEQLQWFFLVFLHCLPPSFPPLSLPSSLPSSLQAISNPNSEHHQTIAWRTVCPLVVLLRRFYEYALELESALCELLSVLCSPDMNAVEQLEMKQVGASKGEMGGGGKGKRRRKERERWVRDV